MYKALHQPSDQEIVILDARWKAQIDYLRELDKQDTLVCPGCRQPVRVRAGKFKRPHFAHKHLQNCPFERQSPRLLLTRSVLYDWLTSKFEPEMVEIEKVLDPNAGVRPLDCWVKPEQGRHFTYWIFDRLMPPDERQNLRSLCDEFTLDVQWICLIDLLRPDEGSPRNRLHLTTTERSFQRQSELDEAWQTHFEQLGCSLHYLDPDQHLLTSYRNLTLIHKPQLYSGKRLQNPLAEVLVSQITGEFVHPGEFEQLQRSRQKIADQQRQTKERRQRAEDFLKRASFSKGPAIPQEAPKFVDTYERKATCRVCGKLTSDWVTYFGQSQECICRACKDRV